MTAEQLQHARAEAWRQDGNALLTADDAGAWLRETGLMLFLPRTAQIAAPAPTFVEATMGEADATPKPAAIANANSLLHRLLASQDVLALNLLGIPGDQPDFLATQETFPFLFALRGDREWERGPRGKSTPLVLEVWKLLDRAGALSAEEIKDQLGKQLTETAALRALTDLWTGLRVEPVYSESEGTRWQRMEVNHAKAMKAGSAMAQGMALSALVSLYLQSAVAASADEIEAFLSPVTSRSRVREAVRGLIATRQVHTRNLGAHELLFVEGSLPEFAEEGEERVELVKATAPDVLPKVVQDLLPEVNEPTDVVVEGESGSFRIEALSEAENEKERTIGEGRKRFVAARGARPAERSSFASRGERPRRTFSPGAGAGERKPRAPFHAREPWKEDQRPAGDAGERTPFANRKPFGERKTYGAAGGDRKPFVKREGGPGGDRGFASRGPRADGGEEHKPFGDRKPFAGKPGGKPFGERKPFERKTYGAAGGDRKPFVKREGGPDGNRGFASGGPRTEGGEERKPFGDRKPFAGKPGGGKSFGDRKPFGSRPAFGDRKPFDRAGAGSGFGAGADSGGTRPPRRGFPPREDGPARPYKPRTESAGAPPSGDRKPFAPRPGSGDGERQARKPFGQDREGGAGRPYGKSAYPKKPYSGGSSSGGSSAGGYRSAGPSSAGRGSGPGERREFRPRDGAPGVRPFKPRAESGDRAGGGRPGGDRRPFRSEGSGDRPFKPRSFKPREEGARPYGKGPAGGAGGRPFRKPEGDGDGGSMRRSGGADAPAPKRFGAGERPSRPGAPVARPGGKRPRTTGFTSSGKPRAGVKTTGRPGPRSVRTGAGSGAAGRPTGPKKFSGKPGGKPRGKGPKRG